MSMKNILKRLSVLLLSLMLFITGLPVDIGSVSVGRTVEAQAATEKINKTKKTLYVGDTYTLKVKNASGKYTWTSSKKSVAKVKTKTAKKTVITALKPGKATIKATRNGRTFKCRITVKERPATTPVPSDEKIDAPVNTGINEDAVSEPYLSPSSATIKVNEVLYLNLVGAEIVFISTEGSNEYAEIDFENLRVIGKKECKELILQVHGIKDNDPATVGTYDFKLTVAGYMDPVPDGILVLTDEDKKLNAILEGSTYGILSTGTKKKYESTYTASIATDNDLIKAVHNAFEQGASKIYLKCSDPAYWAQRFAALKWTRSEINGYTDYYGISDANPGELIIQPYYKEGWQAVLAMRYSGYEAGARVKKLWREAYKLAKEASDRYPGDVKGMLSYINLALCDMTTYNIVAPNHDDASGVLLNGKALCAGYASALRLILSILNIENRGMTNSAGTHEWNEVRIDGKWYHIDVTWNDIKKSDGTYYNDFFLLTDEQLAETIKRYSNPEAHKWNPFIL